MDKKNWLLLWTGVALLVFGAAIGRLSVPKEVEDKGMALITEFSIPLDTPTLEIIRGAPSYAYEFNRQRRVGGHHEILVIGRKSACLYTKGKSILIEGSKYTVLEGDFYNSFSRVFLPLCGQVPDTLKELFPESERWK